MIGSRIQSTFGVLSAGLTAWLDRAVVTRDPFPVQPYTASESTPPNVLMWPERRTTGDTRGCLFDLRTVSGAVLPDAGPMPPVTDGLADPARHGRASPLPTNISCRGSHTCDVTQVKQQKLTTWPSFSSWETENPMASGPVCSHSLWCWLATRSSCSSSCSVSRPARVR